LAAMPLPIMPSPINPTRIFPSADLKTAVRGVLPRAAPERKDNPSACCGRGFTETLHRDHIRDTGYR